MSYLVVFTQEKTGYFSASVPALPGCFSQGKDLSEAKTNIQEAIELYLEYEAPQETLVFEIRPIEKNIEFADSLNATGLYTNEFIERMESAEKDLKDGKTRTFASAEEFLKS